MADLEGLKNRVEQIDLRLKTAHRARESESAALMDLWEQIRERFTNQNAEISELRDHVADLEDARDDLLQMVHGLLAAVEGGIERMSDETVPRIKAMAGDLLERSGDIPSQPTAALAEPAAEAELPQVSSEPNTQKAEETNFHDDLLSAIEKSIETVRHSSTSDQRLSAEPPTKKEIKRPSDEPTSPGIRNLVARIETAVGAEFFDTLPDVKDEEITEDELSRDLREIEALRGELNGLRERISSGT